MPKKLKGSGTLKGQGSLTVSAGLALYSSASLLPTAQFSVHAISLSFSGTTFRSNAEFSGDAVSYNVIRNKNMATPVNTAVVPVNTGVSNIVPMPGTNLQLTSFLVPAAWVNTAGVVVLGSYDGVNTFPIFSSIAGAYIFIPTANITGVGVLVGLRIDDFTGIPYIAFQSGSISSAGVITNVNQTGTLASRTITFQTRAFQ